MHCMSCKQEMGVSAKIFHKLLLCHGCHEMAEKSEREIVREIEMAKGHAMNWLTDHILRGGLFAGGDGHVEPAQAARGVLPNHPGMSRVPGTKAARRARGEPPRGGDDPPTR